VTSGTISLGTGSYGPNGNGTCSNSTLWSGTNPWSTSPTQASVDYPFPIDYTTDFPACGGSGEAACQSNGYPPFCTVEGQSVTLTGSGSGDTAITGNVYCASGSGSNVKKSDPSTWNGSITIDFSGNNTFYDTFVGGSISYTGSGTQAFYPCGYSASGYSSGACSTSVPRPATTNYPLYYATGTSSSALSLTVSGSAVFTGDVFAPNGTARLTMSGTQTLVTCVEANNVTGTISGKFKGDGPPAGSTGSAGGGTVSLSQ